MILILSIILAIVILWVIFSFNSLITMVNRAKEAWADIDVQLKRRYDLIPNLVNTVKGYATHESQAFENVSKARAAAMGAGSTAQKGEAEATLVGALKSRGVRFEVCEITLKNRNLKKDQFILDTDFTPSGVARIGDLQFKDHFAYIKP